MSSYHSSINQEKQQQVNRSLVIDLLRQERICSRAELAELSGLNRATITNIINEFKKYDLVVETGILNGAKGRRAIGIRINGQKYRTIGVMVTREYFYIGMFGISGEVYSTELYEIPRGEGAGKVMERIKHTIRKMLEKHGQVLAIGMAIPGPYKIQGDKVVYVTNLEGWEETEILREMQKDFDIPFVVVNDANAGACAQQWFRKKKSEQTDIVYVVAGQGIGCGIILDGELQTGRWGLAGEIGHTSIDLNGPRCGCGNRGCLEQYCSSIAIVKKVKERILQGETSILQGDFSFAQYAEAVQAGDELAREEYRRACEYLAVGIVNLINLLNPGDIVIGDLLTEVEPEWMLQIIQNKVKEIVSPVIWKNVNISLDQLDYNPILIGAGVTAAQKVFENPLDYIKRMS